MPHIELLDQTTIDQIAAGEVIERPASVVKELVENAIDAGATAIVVEIEEGGIAMMRISDNGCGIPAEEVRSAFLRHSTSKIRSAQDLFTISSLGFRGEALSSIAAVSQVEMITKPAQELLGVRYVIEGGREKTLEETGAPTGTTFLVRQLFYNTPARRKFLRTPMTEASHIADLLTRLALSHPEISFQLINNRQNKLHTSGNGRLRDVIYHVYGREVANELLPLEYEREGFALHGFLGKPQISRGNRNFENYFVNGRYIRSNILSKAIEDGYKDFTMQHRYPFVAFHLQMEPGSVDINVHPTKMELRFRDQVEVYNLVFEAVRAALHQTELIPEVEAPAPPAAWADPQMQERADRLAAAERKISARGTAEKSGDHRVDTGQEASRRGEAKTYAADCGGASGHTEAEGHAMDRGGASGRMADAVRESPAPYGAERRGEETRDLQYFMQKMRERVAAYHQGQTDTAAGPSRGQENGDAHVRQEDDAKPNQYGPQKQVNVLEKAAEKLNAEEKEENKAEHAPFLKRAKDQKTESTLFSKHAKERKIECTPESNPNYPQNNPQIEKSVQLNLFDEQLLPKNIRQEYTIVGQIFDTYWLVQYQDSLYIIDQHAAHERVLYERTLAGMKNREYTSQYISPPIVLSLSMQEEEVLRTYGDRFAAIGFEIEPFGGEEYAVRAVPDNLFGIARKDLLLELFDMLSDGLGSNLAPDLIDEKIASMSCKAAVKGNSRLSAAEVDTLIGELLTLDNPYHCPHGRPTILAMTRRELEKKFKRIV